MTGMLPQIIRSSIGSQRGDPGHLEATSTPLSWFNDGLQWTYWAVFEVQWCPGRRCKVCPKNWSLLPIFLQLKDPWLSSTLKEANLGEQPPAPAGFFDRLREICPFREGSDPFFHVTIADYFSKPRDFEAPSINRCNWMTITLSSLIFASDRNALQRNIYMQRVYYKNYSNSE